MISSQAEDRHKHTRGVPHLDWRTDTDRNRSPAPWLIGKKLPDMTSWHMLHPLPPSTKGSVRS